MSDIMIDLETMSTAPDAAIVAIGAVQMDVETGVGSTFYRVIDLQSALDYGGRLDASTIMRWMRQSDAARAAIQGTPPLAHLAAMLRDLRQWMADIGPLDERRVWGNGAGFDLPILSSASRRLGQDTPLWHHWNERCYRTLKNLHRQIPAGERIGTLHNALDDALHQAHHWVVIMRAMYVCEVAPAPSPAAVVVDDGSEGGDPA